MKSVTSTSHRDSPSPSVHSQPPLTPTYITPRTAPKPPTSPSPFKLPLLFRKRTRAASQHSASTTTSSSDNHPSHPYSTLHMPPIPVVSSHSVLDDDDECPVCLEPLSFSFRLPGEKPHIVPECGHALHEVSTALPCTKNHLIPTSRRHASPPFMAHLPAKGALFLANPISVSAVCAGGP